MSALGPTLPLAASAGHGSSRGLLACDCRVVLVVGEASLMLLQAAWTFPSTRSRVDRSQNSILKIQVICSRRRHRLKRQPAIGSASRWVSEGELGVGRS